MRYHFFFYYFEQHGSIDDMYVQITGHCDPIDKEKRKPFWIKTLYSKQCIQYQLNCK